MTVPTTPTQIAAQSMAAKGLGILAQRTQSVLRRIETTDLAEIAPQPALKAAAPAQAAPTPQPQTAATPPSTQTQSFPARPTRPGSLLDIKV